MIFADGTLGLIVFGLWIFCIIDVITTDESQCRNLPKLAWLFIVLFLFDIGSIIWLIAGSARTNKAASGLPYKGNAGNGSRFPEYERQGRIPATNPDDDEAFLRQCRERAEKQRQQLKRNQQAQEDGA
ncbi:phospholipase D-like protein [Jatrophihabitans sp. GAS493]|uniref:PLD nuclease N-terminal domain-containing protein n=1 Tax=Jatrophihabitans sp. GAS493 TaxID=1907575 RepID=UPI000BB762AB|nr:PLD nuclease N-terminal domain-containing protein [Jatrophihabitans sp. GAS493]SOD74432.1 phospholipase D-like protein [Jatrophihabitans sp. GAS493]